MGYFRTISANPLNLLAEVLRKYFCGSTAEVRGGKGQAVEIACGNSSQICGAETASTYGTYRGRLTSGGPREGEGR